MVMIFAQQPPTQEPLRAAISAAYLADETACLEALLPEAEIDANAQLRVAGRARQLVMAVRAQGKTLGGLDAFMREYDLSSEEGVVLMCLAEALLRIPDAETADRLIRDKLAQGRWDKHLGHSRSLFVNASTWGLMLTGRIVRLAPETVGDVAGYVGGLASRVGEPVVRVALTQAMRIMGQQFVMGRTIEEALKRSHTPEHRDYLHSFDMLGEAALSADDAERYYQAYVHAINTVAGEAEHCADIFAAPGISLKLSALHPRFEFAKRERVLGELVPRVHALANQAMRAGIAMTLDTEEAGRLDITLDVFEAVYRARDLRDWHGLGLAVQSYQKRAVHVVAWLIELARRHRRRIPVRLVKGAYWDTEIKHAQQQGLAGYPVFTRKPSTDVSYLACAKRIWAAGDVLYPQFATHNAHTVAFVLELAGAERGFEFQRLHGMGQGLYDELVGTERLDVRCRIYAPVGSHEDLLPYLVRRLLENGANTSFVNRVSDEKAPLEEVIADPLLKARQVKPKPHPRIALPRDLYGEQRRNSAGVNLDDINELLPLAQAMTEAMQQAWLAAPVVSGKRLGGKERAVTDPADRRRVIGRVLEADEQAVAKAVASAVAAAPGWDGAGALRRAECLERAADLLETHRAELMVLCVREAGKTIAGALAEIREASDFCLYYAALARQQFGREHTLPGPTGERNQLSLHGRGAFVCISPWNFPLAIFTGQIAAALAAGNAVIAKPAEQTALVAALATTLLHEAGIPADVLQLLPGAGAEVGARLVGDARISGVAFTGSTETARGIHQALATRPGPIIPLIAETGGQNAMIVDSSALPEQVVADVLESAFDSAGQRCSACRVLFVQQDIASRVINLLQGAMAELAVGDPALLSMDVGPVIDSDAWDKLEAHAARMRREGKLIYQVPLAPTIDHGTYFAPCAFEIEHLSLLEREVFGPILHVIAYAADKLEDVIDAINATGYGLTLGIHSRIDETVRQVQARARVGNIYVNRNMIGATVGAQPFGGEGLSGTGPKAGGPHYLQRFATERTVTVNTAAIGGNATLLAMGGDQE
ncbi:MAG: bifunctional proline dehydrogenase/L-glutamate gamma-semialdehyde dehydrogenase PutA [Gammaproteobacteria bacterium]|nr:MAG: bifunctional proline dehydrogenase/L-glutamate gamma-semialdehyde dehydrogenase PutA [Gammaproteobacteria bacterium]